MTERDIPHMSEETRISKATDRLKEAVAEFKAAHVELAGGADRGLLWATFEDGTGLIVTDRGWIARAVEMLRSDRDPIQEFHLLAAPPMASAGGSMKMTIDDSKVRVIRKGERRDDD